MRALLDTSLLVEDDRSIDADLVSDGFAVSIVSIGELEAAVMLARDGATRAVRLRTLLSAVDGPPVLGVDHLVSSRYAELRAAVGRRPSNDLWIAATALAHGLVLVTADERQAQLPLVRTTLVT